MSTTELIIIATVLLILFGDKKLPELGRGLGQSIKEFKKSVSNNEPKKKKK
ncbi:preprotein translocase [Candidatus Woesebacteria bacterium RBG_13_34_9]|uniref:Sec-independent protein translocase protein TatA n=1 Tax=Candidatus Woesebacteria bacterium RBG_13_34_9 TaxID=1802477 RepID=A0A1F7X035_9BACT|nr:MAG: preprotein translocase [Candidatus Woesebacteria bacterium RBG_13_34_9]